MEYRNVKEALSYFQAAAKQGNADAMYGIGLILLDGDGEEVQANPQIAYSYFRAAYESGLPISAYQLAKMSDDGIGCEKNTEHALQYYKVAIENGVAGACAPYAKHLLLGDTCPKNPTEARRILSSDLAQKDADATFYYAELLAGDRNIEEATKMYLKAVDLGNVEAMNSAAVIL